MKTADLPRIVDAYITDARVVLTHPRTYVERLGLYGSQLFLRGTTFALLSVGLSYVLMVPVFWFYERIAPVTIYELMLLFVVIVYGAVVHVCLKMLGGTGTIQETIGVYGYFIGIVAPIQTLLSYPISLRFGPELVLLAVSPRKFAELHPDGFQPEDELLFCANILIVQIFEGLWLLFSGAPALAYVQGFRSFGTLRTCVALAIPLVVAFAIGLIFA